MPSDPRVHITFRAAPSAKDWIDELAAEHRADRSLVIRYALALAKHHETELRQLLKDRP